MAGWHKSSRQSRGYGAEWVKTRTRILIRDLYLCQPCLAKGRPTEATEVDHVKPKAKGGTDDDDNLQAICHPCHVEKTQAEAAEAQGRTIKPKAKYDREGRPIW